MMKFRHQGIPALALLAATPAAAEPMPLETATCPFEQLMSDQKLMDAAAITDGKYGLSAELEAAILTVIGKCVAVKGWSAEEGKFAHELTRAAMIVTELEDTLSAAGIMPDEYTVLLDDLSDEQLSVFGEDASKTSVKQTALAKLATSDKPGAATHSEMLIQFLQGDAKGRLLGMQVTTEGVE